LTLQLSAEFTENIGFCVLTTLAVKVAVWYNCVQSGRIHWCSD